MMGVSTDSGCVSLQEAKKDKQNPRTLEETLHQYKGSLRNR